MANFISSGSSRDCFNLNGLDFMIIYVGGTANSTTINNGSLSVSSGGTANRSFIYGDGKMFVSYGGIANSTSVNPSGSGFVYSGGTANSTSVNSNGYLYIGSGGTATNIVWTPCEGHVYIDNGAVVTFASQYFGVYYGANDQLLSYSSEMYDKEVGSDYEMFVMSGGVASNASVSNSGGLDIFCGGTADSTTVNSRGSMHIYSGGTATNIVWTPCEGHVYVYDGAVITFASQYSGVYYGSNDQLLSHATEMSSKRLGERQEIFVMFGGTANSTTVSRWGASLYVASGGTANRTTIENWGSMFVSSGGTAKNTNINSEGNLWVSTGGTASYTTINSQGHLLVNSGGVAETVNVNSDGLLVVSSGGTATNINASSTRLVFAVSPDTYVAGTSEGTSFEIRDGIVSNYTVDSGGELHVYSGGTANSTTVNSSGFLRVAFGGTAAEIVAAPGARLDLTVSPDTDITGTSGDSAFDFKNGTASYYTIDAGNALRIASGCVASRAYVCDGTLDVFGGGTAVRTFISGGNMIVSSGGTANSTTINKGDVYINGTADTVTVNGNALFVVSSGGTATNINASSTRLIFAVSPDTYIAGTSAGKAFEIGNGIVSNYLINKGGELDVCSGGTANSTTVNSGGQLHISSGGTAYRTVLNSGGLTDNYGRDFIAYDCGRLIVSNGGTAISTTISCGRLEVSSNATANNTILSGGVFTVFEGGAANNTVLNGFENRNITSLFVLGTANSTTINNFGSMRVYSNGTADSVTINSGGILTIYDNSTANNVTVNSGGYLYVSNIASNVRINSGGSLTLDNKLTGKISIANGGIIQTGVGAVIDFDISRLAPAINGPLVNNLSLIQGIPTFTVTVSDFQANGVYKLAKGVAEFDNLISIKNASGTTRVAGVDDTVFLDGVEYTLALTGDLLSITVTGGEDIPDIPIYADITEPTNQVVTVNAGFSEDAIVREYSFDTEMWFLYKEPVVLSKNGSVYFLGRDERGVVNEIASYEVTNIDSTPPRAPSNQASEVNGYAVNLSWSAASDTGVGVARYEYRIATSSNYSQILESGTTETCAATVDGLKYGKYYWSVRAVDAAGNAGSWSTNKSFSTVDEVAPDIPVSLVCSVENQSTLSVSWDESKDDSLGRGLNRYDIQLANDETFGSIVKSFSTTAPSATIGPLSRGDYYLRVCAVDNAGNKSDWTAAAAFTIETDTIPPTISGIKADITEPTNGNVTVTATFNDNYALETSQYKIGNDGEWADYKNGVIVTENAVVYFRAVDTTGNETEASYEVKNIDRTKPVIMIDGNTQTPVQQTTLTATTDDGSAILYRINNSGEWTTYTGTIAILANASYSFKATDAAGNTGTAEITFKNIDTTPPVLTLTADTVTLSNSVTLTAETNEETVISYSSDNKNWTIYEGAFEVRANGRYYFKAVDVAGNVDNAEIEFTNIDAVAPTAPTGLRSFVDGQDIALLWNVSTDDFSGVKEYIVKYSHDDQEFTDRTTISHYVLNNAAVGTWSWSVQAVDFAGNESAIIAGENFTVSGLKPYVVEYSPDNFEHTFRFNVFSPTLNTFRMPGGTYQMRVREEGNNEWTEGDPIVAAEIDDTPQHVKSDMDGNSDIFFANAIGTWESGYVAQHVGSIGDWAGTNEYITLFGKNKLADIIEGSTDANILLMTDDSNGDALFVDDIYTALPGSIAEQQARIAQIDEIRAGAGADIVDMTSQRFKYIGDGLTIRGGEGNDTIWANKGSNFLFGDAGNDRIVGASGEDVIGGGIGNDRMHGGGGNDVFTFCDNWGVDSVEQLASGTVTLWFASEEKGIWDTSSLTYTDGENSVKVTGVTVDKITLLFGDDGSVQFATLTGMGAFFDATTERIFEESGKGILASL